MASLSRKGLQDLIKWYQNETGIMEFPMPDVAKWVEAKGGVPMPVPPTPVELLAKKLAAAARADRRDRPDMATDYRGTLAYERRVDGQMEFYWFDADGPAATLENVRKANNLRRDGMINDGVQIRATEQHWMLTHPGQGVLQTDLNLTDEVTWRLNGAATEEGQDEKKAG